MGPLLYFIFIVFTTLNWTNNCRTASTAVFVRLIVSTAYYLHKGKGVVHHKDITFPSLNSPLHVCVNSA